MRFKSSCLRFALSTPFTTAPSQFQQSRQGRARTFSKARHPLEEVTATNTSEVFQAVQVLAGRKIQAL
jgi:hypothetical protein